MPIARPSSAKKKPIRKPVAKTTKAASDFEKVPTKEIGAAIAKAAAKAPKKKKSPFRAAAQSKLNLKKFESMIRNQTTHITPADLSSILKFQKSFEDFGEINGVLLLTSKDAARLISAETFINWFDPQSRVDVIKTGKIGSFWGLQVWTDAYEPMDKRFIKNSVFIYIG